MNLTGRLQDAIVFYLESLAENDTNEYLEAIFAFIEDEVVEANDYIDAVEEAIQDQLNSGGLNKYELETYIDFFETHVRNAEENNVYQKIKVADIFNRMILSLQIHESKVECFKDEINEIIDNIV